MAETSDNTSPPEDKYNMVFLILLMHGVGILMPWNMFITARSYFVDYKMSKNYTGEDSQYATCFLSYVGFASHIPNIIFNWINTFINIGGSTTPRIIFSISVEILIFIITIILAVIDTSLDLSVFFWCTMVCIMVLNMANGIYQNTIFGLAAALPSKYSGVIILGSNISGILVSFIDLVSIIIAPNIKTAAVFCFITALFVLLICLITYFLLRFLKFYTHYELLRDKSVIREVDAERTPYWLIFKKASSQLFNVFFVFFVTLSIFPAVEADIKKSDPEFIIPEEYYEIIMCFITFNVTATLGCLLSSWISWPSPKNLLIPVLLRVLFIPFFFFCNYQPTNKVRNRVVLFRNDWVYWAAAVFMGLSSGYFSAKALIYTTRSVEAKYGPISGKFGAAVIVTGIFAGVIFSMIFPWLAEI